MSYSTEVLADSPIGYWRLEETSGTTAADSAGTNDLTVFGANLVADTGLANLGSGASFDDVDDHLSADISLSSGSTGPRTVEAWIKVPAGGAGTIYAEADSAGT